MLAIAIKNYTLHNKIIVTITTIFHSFITFRSNLKSPFFQLLLLKLSEEKKVIENFLQHLVIASQLSGNLWLSENSISDQATYIFDFSKRTIFDLI